MSGKRRKERDIAYESEVFVKRGYYPARTAHLHPDLKRLLRGAGIRPGIKQCFANCQQIILASAGILYNGTFPRQPILADRLVYHEGIGIGSIGQSILHAWLTLDGIVQDPTAQGIKPHSSHSYTAEQVRARVAARESYGPVDEAALELLMHLVWADSLKSDS